jgi:hypothetical protein
MGVSGQCHSSATLYPRGERTLDTHWTGDWVDPRASLDTEVRRKTLYLCRGSNLDRLVIQSIARHYTDWATLAPKFNKHIVRKHFKYFWVWRGICGSVLEILEYNKIFMSKLVFSDKAIFHLFSNVSKHVCHIWAIEYPRVDWSKTSVLIVLCAV